MILIKNGRVVDPVTGVDEAMDVLIEGAHIEEVGRNLSAAGAEVIDASGLVHVGVVGVVGRDWRHRVDDDIGIGIAGLNGLHQRSVVSDKVLGIHAVVVGAQHDDHGEADL